MGDRTVSMAFLDWFSIWMALMAVALAVCLVAFQVSEVNETLQAQQCECVEALNAD